MLLRSVFDHSRTVTGRRRRLLPIALAAALAVPLAGPLTTVSAAPAPPAAASSADFSTSFEAADQVQPLTSTVETDKKGKPKQRNVTGTAAGVPGSLLDTVTAVSASDENPPGELAANLADRNSGTKWLVFATTAG